MIAGSYNLPTSSVDDLSDRAIAIETTSRAALLRQSAEAIAAAINTAIATEKVQPSEIAIIAPGADNIAEYALREILSKQNIPFMPLNPQKPIINNPQVRSLLTLLTLVYPNLGRMVNRDQVAEMLVVLSQVFKRRFAASSGDRLDQDIPGQSTLGGSGSARQPIAGCQQSVVCASTNRPVTAIASTPTRTSSNHDRSSASRYPGRSLFCAPPRAAPIITKQKL
jgi:hypothetical protein